MNGTTVTLALLALAGLVATIDLVRMLFGIARAHIAARRFEVAFWSGGDLGKLYEATAAAPRHPIAAVFLAGMDEWRRSNVAQGGTHNAAGRAASLATLAARRAVDAITRRTWRPAAIATAAPLAGLAGALAGLGTEVAVAGLALGAAAVSGYCAATEMTRRLLAELDGFATELVALVERQAEVAGH